MNTEEKTNKIIKCTQSLLASIQYAGGTVDIGLEKMSAIELIELIGPNDIKFYYDPPDRKA